MIDVVAAAVDMLRKALGSNLLGIGIGGSHAVSRSDQYSDIDVFVVVIGEWPDVLSKVLLAMAGWGQAARGIWVPGFGWQLIAVSPQLGLLEVFVNTPLTLVPDILWQRTSIIEDRGGHMGKAGKVASSLPHGDPAEDILVAIALAAHSLRKQVHRHRYFDTHRLLDELRRQIGKLAVLMQSGTLLDSKEVFRDILWTKPDWRQRLERCVPVGHNTRSLCEAVRATQELLSASRTSTRDVSSLAEGCAKKWLEEAGVELDHRGYS